MVKDASQDRAARRLQATFVSALQAREYVQALGVQNMVHNVIMTAAKNLNNKDREVQLREMAQAATRTSPAVSQLCK